MNQNLNSGSSAGLPVCLKRAQPSFRPTTPDGEHSTADSGQPTSAPQNHCVQSAESSRLWLPFDHNLNITRPTALSLTPRLSARCCRSAQPPQPFQRLTDGPVRICL